MIIGGLIKTEIFISKYAVPAKPTLKTSTTKATEGENVTLTCGDKTESDITYKFEQKDKDYEKAHDRDSKTLSISKVEQSGTYTCIAIKRGRLSKSSNEVHVDIGKYIL